MQVSKGHLIILHHDLARDDVYHIMCVCVCVCKERERGGREKEMSQKQRTDNQERETVHQANCPHIHLIGPRFSYSLLTMAFTRLLWSSSSVPACCLLQRANFLWTRYEFGHGSVV